LLIQRKQTRDEIFLIEFENYEEIDTSSSVDFFATINLSLLFFALLLQI